MGGERVKFAELKLGQIEGPNLVTLRKKYKVIAHRDSGLDELFD